MLAGYLAYDADAILADLEAMGRRRRHAAKRAPKVQPVVDRHLYTVSGACSPH